MSLRTRILLTFGLTITVLVAIVTFAARGLILGRFNQLERRDALQNVARLEQGFARMIAEMHVKSSDWSSWDDAYAFMAHPDPAFVKSNLSISAVETLNLDAILFIDRKGALFTSLSIRGQDHRTPLRPKAIVSVLRKNHAFDGMGTRRNGVCGYVTIAGETLLVSVRPILSTDSAGPSRGWLAFCRRFESDEVRALGELTSLNVSVDRVSSLSDTEAALAESARSGPFVEPLDEGTIRGFTLRASLGGSPDILLSMRKPRAIYAEGRYVVNQVTLLVAVAGLAFGVAILVILERSVLTRLFRLTAEVGSIERASSAASVTISGRDELSGLAHRINQMLAKLRQSEERLESYSADLEKRVLERTREMEHQAFHDALTGLPNRTLFMERARIALARAEESGRGVAAFFIDLDNFKLVNDSLGHNVGDALLVKVAELLRTASRPNDIVARLGGDEFTILLEELRGPHEAEAVAQRVLNALRTPFLVDGHEIFPNGSIGIAFSPDSQIGADELMKNADTAMYCAKGNGKASYAFHDGSMEDRAVERLEIESGLRRALEHGQIEVYYQPLIDLASGRLKGAEALARWNHPTRGPVSPGRFIPIAEETGLIAPIGFYVLEEACRQAVTWEADDLTISVNLSGKQLQRDDVVQCVADVIDRTGLPPARLKLEITESILMKNREDVVAKMHQLKGLGVLLALDDFGTGYSSLATLSAFPIDTLKIDQAFVSNLGNEKEATSIIEAIVTLSKSMKMDVTGEGIETFAQLRLMQDLGCHTGQGYLFDRPLNTAMFEKRVSEETELRWAA